MKEVMRKKESGSIGGNLGGCENYGRERKEEEEVVKAMKKDSLMALPSISIDSSLETDSTGTGSSVI